MLWQREGRQFRVDVQRAETERNANEQEVGIRGWNKQNVRREGTLHSR